jgi:hypothetical protein
MRYLIVLTAVSIPLLSTPALGVDALTTAADRSNMGVQDRGLAVERVQHEAQLALIEGKTADLRKTNAFVTAFGTLSTSKASLDTMSADRLRSEILDLTRLVSLPSDQIKAVQEFLELRASFSSEAAALARVNNTPSASLASLDVAPSFQVNTGSATASYVPGIDFVGKFDVAGGVQTQFQLSLKPDPPSGATSDVAQSIRVNTGVLTANLGMNVSTFAASSSSEKGSLGLEARLGLPVSYQRAPSATPASASASSSTSSATTDFGLLSPEIKLSAWLRYVLIGYRYNYYVAFGNGSDVYSALNHTGAHHIYMATRIDALSGDKSSGKATSPFYLEMTYTSTGNSLGTGTFSLAFAKALTWTTSD